MSGVLVPCAIQMGAMNRPELNKSINGAVTGRCVKDAKCCSVAVECNTATPATLLQQKS
jgi:hypothetical protein